MKRIFRYLLRDKVDLIMFILVIAAVVQIGFLGKDLTPGFTVLALYCFGVMHRLGIFTDLIKEKDQKIKKLNETIDQKDEYIRKIITKYRVNQKDQP